MANSANEVDEYLAGLPSETRAALEGLRATIRAKAPGATEVVSCVPTFRASPAHDAVVRYATSVSHFE